MEEAQVLRVRSKFLSRTATRAVALTMDLGSSQPRVRQKFRNGSVTEYNSVPARALILTLEPEPLISELPYFSLGDCYA
jgi:hypothetical protein